MPAPKAPEDSYSELLQVRVFPKIKRAVDEYIKERRKKTGQRYGYPEFLREAIDEKMGLVEKKIALIAAIEKDGEIIEQVSQLIPKIQANELITLLTDLKENIPKQDERIRKLEEEILGMKKE